MKEKNKGKNFIKRTYGDPKMVKAYSEGTIDFRIICGAKRHHYSMFNVGRSMFDVQSVRCSPLKKNLLMFTN